MVAGQSDFNRYFSSREQEAIYHFDVYIIIFDHHYDTAFLEIIKLEIIKVKSRL